MRVSGSRGYNLARPDSDWDFQGVYAAPTTRMLGLDGEPRTFPGDEYGHLDLPNCCVYEAHKFSKLLLGGNPMAVEMLFGSHHKGGGSPYIVDATPTSGCSPSG